VEESLVHPDLEEQTAIARQICEIGHQIRKTNAWKVRKPLAKLEITVDADCSKIPDTIWQTVLEELNVKNILVNGSVRYPNPEVVVTEEELAREGQLRDILREIQALRKERGVGIQERVHVTLPPAYIEFTDEVTKYIKTNRVQIGEKLDIMM
jgi:hypothetical protein